MVHVLFMYFIFIKSRCAVLRRRSCIAPTRPAGTSEAEDGSHVNPLYSESAGHVNPLYSVSAGHVNPLSLGSACHVNALYLEMKMTSL